MRELVYEELLIFVEEIDQFGESWVDAVSAFSLCVSMPSGF